MADCYAPEVDDLHRRWLPREIYADIGIADPELDAAVAAEPEEAAAAAAVAAAGEIAAQLVGIIGAGRAKSPPASRTPSPPPPPFPAPASGHFAAPACGLEGAVFSTYVCGAAAVAGGPAAAWPVTPYSPVQWQVARNYSMLPPAPPRLPPALPLGTMPRGGTGVFLPRTNALQSARSPAKDGRAAKPWTGGRPAHQQQQKQKEDGAAAPWRSQSGRQQQKATSAAALALPKDWSYSL